MLSPSATIPTVKIGIFRTTSIGDVVLASACLDLLRSMSVPFEVRWIGRKPSLEIISSAFPELIPVELDTEQANYQDQVIKQLSDLHFVVDLQTNIRSRLICRRLEKLHKVKVFYCEKESLARSKMVLAARLRSRRSPLPQELMVSKTFQFELMVNTLKAALRARLPEDQLDGLDSFIVRPHLETGHDIGDKPWQKELRFGSWLAVAPGAAHPTKKAPRELFASILENIRLQMKAEGYSEVHLGIIFLGGEAEREDALKISDSLMWQGPLLNLVGRLSLWESTLALKQSLFVLSNDSSLAHIGEAVGTPCATLFGPTVEAFGFSPWRRNSRAFSSDLGCRPCSKHGQAECRFKDHKCFSDLSAEKIGEHIWSVLRSSGAISRSDSLDEKS